MFMRICDAIDAQPAMVTLFIVLVAYGVIVWEIKKEKRTCVK